MTFYTHTHLGYGKKRFNDVFGTEFTGSVSAFAQFRKWKIHPPPLFRKTLGSFYRFVSPFLRTQKSMAFSGVGGGG